MAAQSTLEESFFSCRTLKCQIKRNSRNVSRPSWVVRRIKCVVTVLKGNRGGLRSLFLRPEHPKVHYPLEPFVAWNVVDRIDDSEYIFPLFVLLTWIHVSDSEEYSTVGAWKERSFGNLTGILHVLGSHNRERKGGLGHGEWWKRQS